MEGGPAGGRGRVDPIHASATALMRATGYPDALRNATPLQAQAAHLEGISALWFFQSLPLFELMAELRNMMGGKRKKEGPGEPPLKPEELYSGIELMMLKAPYAVDKFGLSRLPQHQLQMLDPQLLEIYDIELHPAEPLPLSAAAAAAVIAAAERGWIVGPAMEAFNQLYPRYRVTAKPKRG